MNALLRGLLLCGAMCLAGCIMRPGPGSDPNTGGGGGGGGGGASAIVVRNNSDATICYVNFSSADDDDWGGDQLGSNETVGPGGSRSWPVAAGTWDVRLQD